MIKKLYLILFIPFLYACDSRRKKETNFDKSRFYANADTIYINNIKFSKKEFNAIVDNFPRLYEDEVLHPDSLYKLEFSNPNFAISYEQNISFDSDAGQDRFFALYTHFLTSKNNGTRFEYLRKQLNTCYQSINTIFERLNRGGSDYIHQSSQIPAYVAYDIYQLNLSNRLPVYTKKTRADRYEFIEDLKNQIKGESTMADISYKFESEKIADLVNNLNEEIINDYVLFKSKEFIKPFLKDFKEIQKENGNL